MNSRQRRHEVRLRAAFADYRPRRGRGLQRGARRP